MLNSEKKLGTLKNLDCRKNSRKKLKCRKNLPKNALQVFRREKKIRNVRIITWTNSEISGMKRALSLEEKIDLPYIKYLKKLIIPESRNKKRKKIKYRQFASASADKPHTHIISKHRILSL